MRAFSSAVEESMKRTVMNVEAAASARKEVFYIVASCFKTHQAPMKRLLISEYLASLARQAGSE